MVRKHLAFSLAALLGLAFAVPAEAQNSSEGGGNGTIADRLDAVRSNLRRNLLGDDSDQNTPDNPHPPAARTRMARPHAARRASPPADEQTPQAIPARDGSPLGAASRTSTGGAATPAPKAAPVPATEDNSDDESSGRRSGLVGQEEASAPQAVRRSSETLPALAPRGSSPDNTLPSPSESTLTGTSRPTSSTPGMRSVTGADVLLLAQKSPLLRVETLGPQQTIVGKQSSFTVRVQNLGDVAAEGVIVKVKLPDWAEVTVTQPSKGNAHRARSSSGAPLVWQIDRLDGRGNEEMLLKIVPHQSQRFDLAVSTTSTPVTSQTVIEVREPKLEVSIAGAKEMLYLETKVYRVTVTNPGTGDAEQVSLQLMPVDGSQQQPVTQSLGTIPAGQSKVLSIELTVRQAGTVRLNTLVTADSGLRAEASEQVKVRRAGLKIDATAPAIKYAGTPTTYSIHVKNPGDASARRVTVEAALPRGSKYLSANSEGKVSTDGTKVSWTLDSIPAGTDKTLEISAILNAPGANQVRVAAGAAGDLTDSASATTEVEAVADLKLAVSDPAGPIAVGEETIYEMKIRNRGTKAANDVDAVAFFSEGVEPIRVEGVNGRVGNGQVVCESIATVAAGSEVIVKIAVKASREGNHVFRAEVRCRANGAHLATEETTLFYQPSGKRAIEREASRPTQAAPREFEAKPLRR